MPAAFPSGPSVPVLMGILNVTPDSFSDGAPGACARHFIEKAGRLIADGAGILDVGGESTRPGASPVTLEDELGRVLPVLRGIREKFPDIPLSLDTRKAAVAEACGPYGISVINDVGFAADEGLVTWAARHGAAYVLMHSRGTPETMTLLTDYPGGLLETIFSEFADKIERVTALGIAPSKLVVDPGFGFAKNPDQCREIAERLSEWRPFLKCRGITKARLLIGVSRKRFLQLYTGENAPEARDEASARLAAEAVKAGFDVVRTHNVALTRRVLCL